MPKTPEVLFVGTNRFVAMLDARTGEEQWRTSLPHGTHGAPVSIVIRGRNVYAGCAGWVYCLDKRTGSIVWENGMPRMGYCTVLLAMEGASGATSQDEVIAEHFRRQQKQRRAAAAGAAS